MILTLACSKPQFPKRRIVKTREIKQAIQQAQNLCFNYEDTPECRSAWELVEELTTAHAHQASKLSRDDL